MEHQNGEEPSSMGRGLAAAFTQDINVRRVLDAIDTIRPFVKDIPELAEMVPAIVVVGDQSAGKSSILERISGVNLPRGDGICTRVPLEMQMRRQRGFSATIRYQPPSKEVQVVDIGSPAGVAAAIEEATMVIAGEMKGVQDNPIHLRIGGPQYQDLTVIDLPGIARVALEKLGQPQDIEERTIAMIKKYISGDSKIILCALPATTDFVTSAALKLALSVDKGGSRTLGVVSKMDLAPKGICKRLTGDHATEVKLLHGYFPVRCRTQEENEAGMTLEEVEKAEANMFEMNSELQGLPVEQRGISALINKLARFQRDRLVAQLPKILEKFEDCRKANKKCIESFQTLVRDDDDAFIRARRSVSALCKRFERIFKCEVSEKDPKLHLVPSITEYRKEYEEEVYVMLCSLCCDSALERVKEVRKLCGGLKLPNFLFQPVFMIVLTEYVLEHLEEPALELVDQVTNLAHGVLNLLADLHVEGTPRLAVSIKSIVREFLDRKKNEMRRPIKLLMSSQKQTVPTSLYFRTLQKLKGINSENTSAWYDHFKEGSPELEWLLNTTNSMPGDEVEKADAFEILQALIAYTVCIKTVLVESVPRMVVTGVVESVITGSEMESGESESTLEEELVSVFDGDRKALFLSMFEPERENQKRRHQETLDQLTEARGVLKGVIGIF